MADAAHRQEQPDLDRTPAAGNTKPAGPRARPSYGDLKQTPMTHWKVQERRA